MSGLLLRPVLVVGRYRILPVEEQRVVRQRAAAGGWLFAESRLHALVIGDGSLVRCLDATGQELPLARLQERLPALATELQRMSPRWRPVRPDGGTPSRG